MKERGKGGRNSGKKGSGSLRLISFMERGKAGWEIPNTRKYWGAVGTWL
jgi:hypothetical protein